MMFNTNMLKHIITYFGNNVQLPDIGIKNQFSQISPV